MSVMMQELRTLKDILEEAVASHGQTAGKLAATTGIPVRFVEALLSGDFNSLPAAPYIKGYLKKLAEALELNADELWERYSRETRPRQSGGGDVLPQNRFRHKTVSKKLLLLVSLGLLVVGYFAVNAKRHFGLPDLYIIYPDSAIVTVTNPLIIIRGRVGSNKDLVSINGAEVFVDEFGEFQKELLLDPGTNSIDVTARRFLGRGKLESLQIIYESPETAQAVD
jgi:hypothetical protein